MCTSGAPYNDYRTSGPDRPHERDNRPAAPITSFGRTGCLCGRRPGWSWMTPRRGLAGVTQFGEPPHPAGQSGLVLDGQPCRCPRCRVLTGSTSHPTTPSPIYEQLRLFMLTSLSHCLATVPDAFTESSRYFSLGRNQSVRRPYLAGGADGPCWKTCLAPQSCSSLDICS